MDQDFTQCLTKQEELKKIIHTELSPEERYSKIISFGNQLPPFPESERKEENRVTGCQSLTYLTGHLENQKMIFHGHSEALITKGLISIVLYVYQNETPQTILQCKPIFLNSLGILASLSPTRAHGLKSFYDKLIHITIKNFNNTEY